MKTEIISKINELAQQEAVLPLSRQFGELTDQFYAIIKEEERVWELKKLELIEAGERVMIELSKDNLINIVKTRIYSEEE